jgi:hypothetical protein
MQNLFAKIPEYVANGVNAFTISLQGGTPGYEGAINTAFDANGSTRKAYLQRVEKVIWACDENHAAMQVPQPIRMEIHCDTNGWYILNLKMTQKRLN